MSIALNLFLITWTVTTSAYIFLINLEIFQFDSVDAYLYLSFCVGLLIFGIAYGKSRDRYLKYVRNRAVNINDFIVNCLCIAGFVGGLVLFIDSGGYVGDLEKQRALHIARETVRVSFFSYVGQFGISGGLIGASLIAWTKQKWHLKLAFLLMNLMGYFFVTLYTGGRVTLLISLLPILFSYLVKHYNYLIKQKFKFILLASTIFLIIVAFMTTLVYLREASRIEYLLPRVEAISSLLNDLGISQYSNLNQVLSLSLYRAFGNLSDGIHHFEPFFKVYDPHPLLGGYQFNFISSRFPGADWAAWKEEIEDCYRYFGMFPNVWGTFIREFVVDFGWVGCPIFCFLAGFSMARLEVRAMQSSALLSLYILSLSWIAMSAFYSLFIIRHFHIAILMLFSWIILIPKPSRKKVIRRTIYKSSYELKSDN